MCLAYQMNGLTVTFPVLFQGSKLSWPAIRFHSCSSDFFSCCVSLGFVSPSASPGFRFSRKKLMKRGCFWSHSWEGHGATFRERLQEGRDLHEHGWIWYGREGRWMLGRVPQHIHLSSVLVKLSWKSTCRSSPGGAWWRRSPWCALQILLLCPGETRLLFFT